MSRDKIFSQRQLLEQALLWRRQRGERLSLVFTNGCFDILHVGHVRYLQAAKRLGDKLVVGLNGDKSLRRLKGSLRPLQGEEARAEILAALSCVDAVTLFHEDTPLALIQAIAPDILVKGGDWAPEKVVGADWVQQQGGQVHLLPVTEGHSTSLIVDKIRAFKG